MTSIISDKFNILTMIFSPTWIGNQFPVQCVATAAGQTHYIYFQLPQPAEMRERENHEPLEASF
jgi:hypothetical protein